MIKSASKKKKFSCKLRKFFRKGVYTSAVIVAGGSGTRFSEETPKQFTLIDGIPVVAYSMMAFEKNRTVDEIVVVCRKGDEEYYDSLAEKYEISKYSKAVIGGATRQKSSLNGVEATSSLTKYVLIHDAARPLVTDDIISRVSFDTHKYRAACAAMPAKDTVKIADENGFVSRTENRSSVFLAATPQGFYKPLYESCAYSAEKDGIEVTDDASLAEKYFYKVKLVDCGCENIKITTPSDIFTAEAILMKRRQSNNN